MHDITFDKKEEKEESQINTSLEEELEKQKQKIEQLNNYINTIQIFPKEEVEKPKEELPAEPIFNEVKEEVPTVVEEVKKVEEIQTVEETTEEKPIDEGDLFSLIDSMYEKRDE